VREEEKVEEKEDERDHTLEETQEEVMEVELEEESREKTGEIFEEVVVEADEGEVLSLDTHHPLRSHKHLSLPTTFHEPLTFSPTPPMPKALTQNFCQLHSEPLLKAPNFELRAFEELVRSKYKKSPTSTIQISEGRVKKRVSKFKRDLFSWLILFQPELK